VRRALPLVLAVVCATSATLPALPAPPPQERPRLFPPQDLGLLEAPDRDEWNKPDEIMDALGIADGAIVADLGAGGGWLEIRLARRVGPNGLVYAEDIQPQMIEAINRRMQHEGLTNVRTVMGTPTDPRLPGNLDAVLIVNAYREMDDPARPDVILTLLKNVAQSLKPQGRFGVADFLPGGGGPGPAPEDRVDPEAIIRAAEGAGFRLQSRQVVRPFVFLLVFAKALPPPRRP
jgi:predicted methyltransferase